MTTESGPGTPTSESLGAAAPGTTPAESTSDLLRSRLSQAAEDQAGEHQELVGAIGDMRSHLLRLGQEIAELRVQPTAEGGVDPQGHVVAAEMREAVRFLSERLDGVTRMLAQRGEELADIRITLTALDAQMRLQGETVGDLAAELHNLPTEDARVPVIKDNLEAVHRQLFGIEESLAAAVQGRAEEQQAAIDTAIAPVTAALADMQEIETAQAAVVADLRRRIEPIADDITAIGTGVTGLVEGNADGAAMDARVSESVAAAMQASERRLMAHIDEAVLALAETLLRRRGGAALAPAPAVSDEPDEPATNSVAPDAVDVADLDETHTEPHAVAELDDDTEPDQDVQPDEEPVAPVDDEAVDDQYEDQYDDDEFDEDEFDDDEFDPEAPAADTDDGTDDDDDDDADADADLAGDADSDDDPEAVYDWSDDLDATGPIDRVDADGFVPEPPGGDLPWEDETEPDRSGRWSPEVPPAGGRDLPQAPDDGRKRRRRWF